MAAGPLAVPLDGSGSCAPVAIYPPGFDFTRFNIFDPFTGDTVSGADYANSPLARQTRLSQDVPLPSGDPQPLNDSSNSSSPTTGFFRVFHIPDFLVTFSGYTFNGPTFIPVDYAAPDAAVDYVDSTTVLIGGQPTDYAEFMPYVINGATNWGVGIYFDRLPNGTNTIQLITKVRQSDTLNDQTPYIVFSNAPAAITIGNLVAFTNWDDLITTGSYTFKAQSSVPNVDWEIDIYDVNNNFVNYQTGHSSNGNIAWTWNLVDYWGHSRNNTDSDPFFYPYITITGNLPSLAQNSGNEPNATSSSAGSWMPPAAAQYPSVGGWIVAYLDNFFTDGRTNYGWANPIYYGGLSDIAGGPAEWNDPVVFSQLKYGRNYTQADRDNSWVNLKAWLFDPHYRNLYYFGHGSATTIGGDLNTLDSSNNVTGGKTLQGSKAYLTSQYVRDTITFNKFSGSRPYRFVYLDCCDTANGDWPGAFGVVKQTEPLSYYKSANNTRHARPSAFVGWDTTIGSQLPGWGTVSSFWDCRSYWMGYWAGTFQANLNDALYNGNDFSHWISAPQFYSHIHIYGYSIMMLDEYNFGGDWSF
jgi:hypothetical protein